VVPKRNLTSVWNGLKYTVLFEDTFRRGQERRPHSVQQGQPGISDFPPVVTRAVGSPAPLCRFL